MEASYPAGRVTRFAELKKLSVYMRPSYPVSRVTRGEVFIWENWQLAQPRSRLLLPRSRQGELLACPYKQSAGKNNIFIYKPGSRLCRVTRIAG